MSTTNHNNHPVLDDESLPPVDWDPAADADEGWTRVVSLMNNADTAPRLATADADGLKAALRERLLAEGILASGKSQAPAEAGSFTVWLRTLLVGGGAGGQVLRLGVVALIAVAGTLEYATPDASPVNSALERGIAESAPRLASKNIAQAKRDEPSVMNDSLEASDSQIAERKLEKDAPAGLDTTRLRADESENAGWEAAAPPAAMLASADSVAESMAEMRSNEGVARRQASGVSGFAAAAPSTLGAAVDAGGSGGQFKTITQAMEALQVAKFTAVLDDNARTLSDLRLVEQTLAAALSEIHRVPDDVRFVVQALERYRSAEDLLDGKRYQEAEDTFEEARRTSPRSFIGFLSQFQVARIRYEHTQDFAGALGAYRSCMEDYPREFLTDEYRDYVRERIEILTRTAADNWEDLHLWTQSNNAPTPRAAADPLLQLLRENPTSYLASRSARKLTDLLMADAAAQTINLDDSLGVMREVVRRRDDSAETARIQFAIAELVYGRSLAPGQAINEYQRALEMKPDAELRTMILERLKIAANERLVIRPEQPSGP